MLVCSISAVVLLLMETNLFCAAGSVTDHNVLSACPGEQLTVTCVTNDSSVTFLEWTIDTKTRRVSVRGNSDELVINPVRVNETSFNISRLSEANVYPFITEVVISPVYGDVNGTEVSCTASSDSVAIRATVINVIGGNPLPPQVRQSEYYGVNDLLVTLELAERDKTHYSVQVEPSAEEISMGGRFDLVLQYNTSYNVSILATTCGQYNSSREIHLMYNSSTCSDGLLLPGSNMTACIRPRNATCDAEGTSDSTLYIVIGVSIPLLIIISIVSLTLGCLCRGFCLKGRSRGEREELELSSSAPRYQEHAGNSASLAGPIYDEVVKKRERKSLDLDFSENEAYGLSYRDT